MEGGHAVRTLFVTHHYLHGNGGGVFASRGFVNAFAKLSERLTLLCPVKDAVAPEGIAPSVRVIPVSYEKPRWRKFIDLLLGRIHRFYGVFDQVLASEQFNLVVFDTCYVSFRLIQKARVPVIPVRFFDRNSRFYYALGLLDYRIRFVRLFHEMFNKHGQKPRMGIGEVISVQEQEKYTDLQAFKAFLRSSVYEMPLPERFVHRSELWKSRK
jgi:hypothetical protein